MILNHKFNLVKSVEVLAICLLTEITPAHAAESAVTDIEALYMQTCYICHGDDGAGYMPGVADLKDNRQLFADKETRVAQRIKQGIDSNGSISMPPKGGNPNLSDAEILALVRYVKQLVK